MSSEKYWREGVRGGGCGGVWEVEKPRSKQVGDGEGEQGWGWGLGGSGGGGG